MLLNTMIINIMLYMYNGLIWILDWNPFNARVVPGSQFHVESNQICALNDFNVLHVGLHVVCP